MQAKTTGIILHTLKYSDSSTIATVYTRQFGRTSYMVYGTGKKRSKVNALLQPLSIVELQAFHKPGKEINHLKEIRCSTPLNHIGTDMIKNSIGLFLSEILYRTLQHDEPDEELFSFLLDSISFLDQNQEGTANFHLVFMLKLTRFLGFLPNAEKVKTGYFDLLNGIITSEKPFHNHYAAPELSEQIILLLESSYNELSKHNLSRKSRVEILDIIIEYYTLHISHFSKVNSMEVLQSLFD